MTRRRKMAVAGIAVALSLAAVVVAVAVRGPSLERRLAQVRNGMTYAEVVEIMGEPDKKHPPFRDKIGTAINGHQVEIWERQRGTVWVHFGANATVFRSGFVRNAAPTGFLDRVLAWLGL